MGKKKKALKAKKALQSKIYMGIFIIVAYLTGLWTISAIAYADLEVCKSTGQVSSFYQSQGPVGFVLKMSKNNW